ncbi:MAG: DUF2911 domain-containing protein [Terracidiphilus sp.]
MKTLLVCSGLLLGAATLLAQQAPPKKPPLSPPATATAAISGKTITITYSSPRVRGREGKIFSSDGVISHDPHYPVWRAGANSATTLETSGDLTIGDVNVPAGKYTLFVDISDPKAWVLIVSKDTGEWGLSYDASKDLGRVKMTMAAPSSMVEELKYTISDGTLSLAWEDMGATVPIAVK